MGVVNDEGCLLLATEPGKRLQRRDIAVHAEDSIGGEQGSRAGIRIKLATRTVDIGMHIATQTRSGEPRTIDQADMIELVLDADRARVEQRLHESEIGHVAGRKQHRAVAPAPAGEFAFEPGMVLAMAAEQMRGRGADAPLPCGNDHRLDHRRMLGEAEIVVTGKVHEALAVDDDIRAVDLGDRAQSTQQRVARTLVAGLGHAVQQRGPRHGVAATRCGTARRADECLLA